MRVRMISSATGLEDVKQQNDKHRGLELMKYKTKQKQYSGGPDGICYDIKTIDKNVTVLRFYIALFYKMIGYSGVNVHFFIESQWHQAQAESER